MPEFKTKEEYEKWKAEKAKQVEEKIKLEANTENNPTLPKSVADNNKLDDGMKPREKSAQPIRKSIARGGLIILASLFIGAALMLISKTYNDGKSNYLHGTFDVFFYCKKQFVAYDLPRGESYVYKSKVSYRNK